MAHMYAFASSSMAAGCKQLQSRRCVKAHAKAGNWLPGAESPTWLDGSIPGDYGFDPLGLAKDPERLSKLQENELINARYAMLAVPGCLLVELAGQGNWWDAPLWAVEGRPATYFGVEIPGADIGLIAVIEIVLMAAVETFRSQADDPEKRKYPGGAFDPLGFAKDSSQLETLKLKEIKNGRLAMLAFLGFLCQHRATGKGPLENLADHLSNPLVNNVGSNGYSVPLRAFNL